MPQPSILHQRLVRAVILCAALPLAISQPFADAQSEAAASPRLPAFDVISVKPNKSGSGGIDIDYDDGNFNASNVPLKLMLSHAYLLKEGQIIGLPPWSATARFDIQAKVLDPDKAALARLTDEQRAAMLQPILTERFNLKTHTETRVLPVYELVVVKGGPKFVAAPSGARQNMTTHNREMTATATTLGSLAAHLSSQLQRVVLDKTGLTGAYDFTLKWSPEDASSAAPDNAPPGILTALQEQLGLKLVASKASVPVVVVDSVEPPTAN